MGQRRGTTSVVLLALMLAACTATGTGDEADLLPTDTFPAQDSPVLDADEVAEILDGASPAPEYNSEPPTSGPHADDYARCGVYRIEIPDLYQVHSLKRGTVVIQYQPTIAAATRQVLEDAVRSLGADAIVAPRSGLAPLVVLTAWTRALELESVDVETVRAFWEDYAQTGPANAECLLEVNLAE